MGSPDMASSDPDGSDMGSPDMGSPDMGSPDDGSRDMASLGDDSSGEPDGADAGDGDADTAPGSDADDGADQEWEDAPAAACALDRGVPTLTILAPIKLGVPVVKEETAIFVPPGFRPRDTVDLLVYFHGHTSIRTVGKYLAYKDYRVREAVLGSSKNVVLAVPMLGPRSEPGSLRRPGGFAAWVDKVMEALGACGGAGKPRLGRLILAAHSGGGSLLATIVTGTRDLAANLSEVWMFDAVYSHVPAWKTYFAGGGGVRARFVYTGHQKDRNEAIRRVAGPHVEVRPSVTRNHYVVPTAEMPQFLAMSSLQNR